MDTQTILDRFKSFVSGIGWILFIWGLGISKERYWKQIQSQENAYQSTLNNPMYKNFKK